MNIWTDIIIVYHHIYDILYNQKNIIMSKKVLFIAVISLFLLLLVPYFQNVIEIKDISFFTVKLRYSSAFRLFIAM